MGHYACCPNKNSPNQTVESHKKVISYFSGTAWLQSRRFLFQQFFHGDKSHKVIGNADALMPLAAGLVRGFNVDRLDKLPQRIGGQARPNPHICIPSG